MTAILIELSVTPIVPAGAGFGVPGPHGIGRGPIRLAALPAEVVVVAPNAVESLPVDFARLPQADVSSPRTQINTTARLVIRWSPSAQWPDCWPFQAGVLDSPPLRSMRCLSPHGRIGR